MKTSHTLFRKIAFLLIGAVVLSSCVKETEHGPRPESLVSFEVSLPATMEVATRAEGTVAENRVKTLDLLVFATGGNLSEIINIPVTAGMFSGTNNGGLSFKVRLANSSTGYDLMLVANANTLINTEGVLYDAGGTTLQTKDKAAVRAALEYSNASAFALADTEAGSIPMYGELTGVTVSNGTPSKSAFTLTRMLAKVSIANSATTFTLTHVYFYNYATKGLIVPHDGYYPNAIPANVGEPSMPGTLSDNSGAEMQSGMALDYTGKVSAGAMTGDLYVFEAYTYDYASPKWETESPCIVVGGTYGGNTYYYRIDFIKRGDSPDTWMNLQRNHSYNVTITSVSGPGAASPGDALKSAPVNIDASVQQWDEKDMGHIVFDGQNFLSVSQDEFNFTSDAEQENNVLYVMTDYAITLEGQQSGWYMEKIDYADGNEGWITLSPDSGAADDKTEVVLTVADNKNGVARSATIWIAAGRMRYAVKVNQSNIPALSLRVTDGDGNPVTELVFANKVPISSQILKVNWQPKTAALTVTNTRFGTAAFKGTDIPSTITGGTGSKEYTITPSAFTSAEIDPTTGGDPLLEKISKIDFTTNNGISTASSSIFLRHVNYAVVPVGVPDYYLLDGNTHYLSVRSNTAWKIKNVIQTNGIFIDNEYSANQLKTGHTGGYNVSPDGEEIKFKFVDDANLSGTIEVVFTSPDNLFVDQTVTINVSNSIWARSNIVWIPSTYSSKGILTFAASREHNTSGRTIWFDNNGKTSVYVKAIPANSQGVFFKWGSLVALSPAGSYNSTSSILFTPTVKKDYTTYAEVPYVSETYGKLNTHDNTDDDFAGYDGTESWMGPGYDASAGKGDICRYISAMGWVEGNWRLPTAMEIVALLEQGKVSAGDPTLGGNATAGSDIYGFNTLDGGVFLGSGVSTSNSKRNPQYGIFVPASGRRSYGSNSEGAVDRVGHTAYIWSGSGSLSNGGPGGYFLYASVGSTGTITWDKGFREYGYSVRCVRDTK